MKRAHILIVLLLSCLGLTSACGFDDPGDGTQTLLVKLEIEYAATANNTNTLTMEVANARGEPVNDVALTITNGENDEVVLNLSGGGDAGNYTATFVNYTEKLAIDLESSEGSLNAKLQGPSPHFFDYPKNSQQLSERALTSGVSIEWSTSDGIAADEVLLNAEAGNYRAPVGDDDGDASLPGRALVRGSQIIDLIRRNRIDLEGGRGGSYMTLGYGIGNLVQTPQQ